MNSRSGTPSGANGDATPCEGTEEHTRILRVMLAADDCVSYWRASTTGVTAAERVRTAFERHWFGTKSEARVRTLLGDMSVRFDSYPSALAALRAWAPPRSIAPWLCHIHTQLADPIYRRFTGEFLPERRGQGYASVDREVVARWVNEVWPNRWSPVTCIKFGANLLATAGEAGLFVERRDPRKLSAPRVPSVVVEYLFYLLREVRIHQPILQSPYLRALAADAFEQSELLRQLSGVRVRTLGELVDFTWTHPDLLSWAKDRREAA